MYTHYTKDTVQTPLVAIAFYLPHALFSFQVLIRIIDGRFLFVDREGELSLLSENIILEGRYS